MSTHFNEIEYLNQLIQIQTQLAEIDFNLDEFMNSVIHHVEKLTGATGVVVELVEGKNMVYRAVLGTLAPHKKLRLPMNGSISGLCVKTASVLVSDDTEEDPRVNLEACRKVGARSLIVAPLFHQGKAVGVIKIISKKTHAFSENHLKTLQVMAGLTGSALAHQVSHDLTIKLLHERTAALEKLKKAEKKLSQMAHYDTLTKLPNRKLFTDRLNIAFEQACRYEKPFSILFLDIDHFKNINDTLGHAQGDLLLKEFAKRLTSCIRKSDTCARLGGDEFVILLNEIHEKENAINVAEKIISLMATPVFLENKPFLISTSIGIDFFSDGITPDILLKQADDALYAAKKSGRNQYKVFE